MIFSYTSRKTFIPYTKGCGTSFYPSKYIDRFLEYSNALIKFYYPFAMQQTIGLLCISKYSDRSYISLLLSSFFMFSTINQQYLDTVNSCTCTFPFSPLKLSTSVTSYVLFYVPMFAIYVKNLVVDGENVSRQCILYVCSGVRDNLFIIMFVRTGTCRH